MSTGRLEVICGEDSSGKTAMALGRALQALTEQKTVIVIQFLKDEEINIRNGLNYAKKVLTTEECDLLVLDEALGLVDQNIVTEEEMAGILSCRDQVQVIVTGKVLPEGLSRIADKVEKVDCCK